MAEKSFLVNEAITVDYQTPGRAVASAVQMDVFDNTSALNTVMSAAMVSVKAAGIYAQDFTPNAQGGWTVVVSDSIGGKVIKSYSVGGYNVSGVGTAVADVDSDVATLDGKVVTLDGKVVNLDGDVATLDGKVVTLGGKVDTVDTVVDAIKVQVDSLESPAMIG